MAELDLDVSIPNVPRVAVPGLVDRVLMAVQTIVPLATISVRYNEKVEPVKEVEKKE